ncbi:hypothetical protein CARUB_v10015650mg [Capsella rubella]|uniref:MATH domain-containing protein n=1 Tax=Capsella rubella TaxID=81985 RepID=R0I7F0_9BRAS|nr:MATH domain and coiled-coil domain-containing protein At1g31390 [Capsella rubella]EOA32383.1 hypothetical protein CARUB_v10015650mg [Capsella rubella]
MGKTYEKKITWTIKNFSFLQSDEIKSDYFVVGGCKWCLRVYPKGEQGCMNFLSLYLGVAGSESLPYGWRRHAKFRLVVVNQLSQEASKGNEAHIWFDQKSPSLGYPEMLPLSKLLDKSGGFLVNGEIKIVAEVYVLEVIGKTNVLEETSFVKETMDVNGFHVPPPLVESVSSLFKSHPDIASEFRPKNPHLRTTYMNVLLSLTEVLGQSPEKLSISDLSDAYSGLQFVKQAGFKLEWLEKKLKEACQTRLQEVKEELKDKCAEMEALEELLR